MLVIGLLMAFFTPSKLFYSTGSGQTSAQQMYYIYTACFEEKMLLAHKNGDSLIHNFH